MKPLNSAGRQNYIRQVSKTEAAHLFYDVALCSNLYFISPFVVFAILQRFVIIWRVTSRKKNVCKLYAICAYKNMGQWTILMTFKVK